MRLTVEHRPVPVPNRMCDEMDIRRTVHSLNPPFVVDAGRGKKFSVRRKVFLHDGAGSRVECDNEDELRMACKLCAEASNRWHSPEDTRTIVLETDGMEKEVAKRLLEPCAVEDEKPKEEEDISIQEWSQLGYKWFKHEDVMYI